MTKQSNGRKDKNKVLYELNEQTMSKNNQTEVKKEEMRERKNYKTFTIQGSVLKIYVKNDTERKVLSVINTTNSTFYKKSGICSIDTKQNFNCKRRQRQLRKVRKKMKVKRKRVCKGPFFQRI